MAGLDPTGFTVKLLTEILQEIRTAQLNRIDPALDVSSEKALGQLNGIYSEREAVLWELVKVAMSAFDPDVAEGYLLEALCALTGTVRRPASRSLVECTVNLDASTTLPQGSVAHVQGQPTKRFRSTADVTSTVAGDYPAVFESEAFGPVAAPAGTLTVPVPVGGWNSITNTADAALGRLEDTDAILRERRASDLSRAGACTPDAIRADLKAIAGIEKVTVFENNTDFMDADGVPAHSVEILVFDGITPAVANNVIAQAIWDTRAPGRTFGNTSGTAIDSEGVARTVYFSRPVQKNVWITVNVDGEGVVPTNAVDLLKEHLALEGNARLQPSVDVIALVLRCILMDTKEDLGYSWVNDVPSLLLGFSNPPVSGANLAITPREIARLDTSRITLTIT